jgi:hypothetical protein
MPQSSLTRRHFLRSAGAMLPLPFFPSLAHRAFTAEASVKPPKRLVFLGLGFGVTAEAWHPDMQQSGRDYALTPGLEPLARHKGDFSVVQGLANAPNVDAHWGTSFWLTGANRFAEPGKSFHNSISVDQVAAAHLGAESRFSSLQLTSANAIADGHGPGLSLAWDAKGKPIAGFSTPLAVFHKLFSAETMPVERRAALLAEERSVLDALMEDARSVRRGLNATDADKLEEYLQGVRDIETRLSKDERWLNMPKPKVSLAEPESRLSGKEEVRVMYDILVAALRTDTTRVVTYRQPLQTLLNSIGQKINAHQMSHHLKPDDPAGGAASLARDRAQSELLAHLLDQLKAVKESDGSSLFDHTCVAYGSNIRHLHYTDNIPTLVAGGGSGFRLGENIVVPKGTPLANLWVTLLQGCGLTIVKHGNSTGVIS